MLKYFNLKNLFLLGFVGGFLISLLKLSNLSTPYGVKMWLIIFVAVFSFILGYYKCGKNKNENKGRTLSVKKENKGRVLKNIKVLQKINLETCLVNRAIIIITVLSLISFIIEVIVLGYVPIFMIGTPHAYSDFHIFGLHYITTSFILIPMLSVISFHTSPKPVCPLGKMSKINCRIVPVAGLIYSIIMPVILVSRFQLISGLAMGIFVYILLNKNKLDIKKFLPIIILFIALYIVITIARSHSVKYLNEIFDMKDKNTPIFITQPYMYVAHNYENLNYLIENLPFYTYGRRIMQPLFALTLTKKFLTHVTTAPSLLIKEELSTGTLIYDFYFDFGILGVILFMFIIGYLMRSLDDKIKDGMQSQDEANCGGVYLLLFGQNAFYMLFSFFQSFYSLTQTWIYMAFSVILALFIIDNKRLKKR